MEAPPTKTSKVDVLISKEISKVQISATANDKEQQQQQQNINQGSEKQQQQNQSETTPNPNTAANSSTSPSSSIEASDLPSGTIILNRYKLEKPLGKGSYGKVRLATDLKTNQQIALKFIPKSSIKKAAHTVRIKREIRILKLLHHPNIVKLYEASETPAEIILAMENAPCGELFDYIVAHKRIKEKEARRFFRQIISAVEYCHKNCVIHRDLKPENLLLDSEHNIKIIDFGFANTFDPDGLLGTFCGSPFYASPEMVVGKKYVGPEVDIWSLGVILFTLLCGYLPFEDANVKALYKKILAGSFEMPNELSPSVKDLISKMIVVDATKRAKIEQVRNHPWLIGDGFTSPPDSFLPHRSFPTVLDEAIVAKLISYDFNAEKTRTKILTDSNSPAFTTYHLIKEKNEREALAAKKQQQQPGNNPSFSQQPQQRNKNIAADVIVSRNGSTKTAAKISTSSASNYNNNNNNASSTSNNDPSLHATSLSIKAKRRASSVEGAKTAVMDSLVSIVRKPSNAKVSAAKQSFNPVTAGIPFTDPFSASLQQTSPQQQDEAAKANPTHNEKPKTGSGGRRFSLDSAASSALQTAINFTQRLTGKSKKTGNTSAAVAPQQQSIQTTPNKGLLNVETTSTKPLSVVSKEVTRVLSLNKIKYSEASPNFFKCSYAEERHGTINEINTEISSENNTGSSDVSSSVSGSSGINFELQICKIEKMDDLLGIHLRRVEGDSWEYKKLCGKLLSQMKL